MSENEKIQEIESRCEAKKEELENKLDQLEHEIEEKLDSLEDKAEEESDRAKEELRARCEEDKETILAAIVEQDELMSSINEDLEEGAKERHKRNVEDLRELSDAVGNRIDALEAKIDGKKEQVEQDVEAKKAKCAHKEGSACPYKNFMNKSFQGKHVLLGVVITALVCLAISFGVNAASGGGSLGSQIDEGQLDSPVASYTFNGKQENISARDVLSTQGPIEQAKTADGKYAAPSAEAIIDYTRTQVLLKEAEKEGISASDEEVQAFAKDQIGESDYDALAKTLGADKEQVEKMLKDSTILQKLAKEKQGEQPEAPKPPTEPEKGKEDKATEAYAEYIIKLAGDQWNAEKGTWANEESPYKAALGDFDGKKATYKQAEQAFQIAGQTYAMQASSGQDAWRTFINDIFSSVNLEIHGIFA